MSVKRPEPGEIRIKGLARRLVPLLAGCLLAGFFSLIPWAASPVEAADCASFQGEVNYPKGTEVPAGRSFSKGWRLYNCGEERWRNPRAVRVAGDIGPTSFAVPELARSSSAEVWAVIEVPASRGGYSATYQLEGAGGRFGDPFSVEIVVPESVSDCAGFLVHLNYPGGTPVLPGESFIKGWRVFNCGNTPWTGASAVRVGGDYGPTSFSVVGTGPGLWADLWSRLTVPSSPGTHRATYQLRGPRGFFGDQFWVEIVVSGDPPSRILEGPPAPAVERAALGIPPDGTLIKGPGPSVYVIEDGHKRWIPNAETFSALGYQWEWIRDASQRELDVIPTREPIPAVG